MKQTFLKTNMIINVTCTQAAFQYFKSKCNQFNAIQLTFNSINYVKTVWLENKGRRNLT